MAPSALLELEQVEVVYHRVATAVQGVSLRVEPRQIVALLGPNGAGKTTTLRAVSGFLPADDARITAGHVRYKGETVTGLGPHHLARRGLVLVPEREKVFESLTVAENLRASRRTPRPGRAPIRRDDVFGYFPVLADRRQQLAGYLSGGERQMLAIACGLVCQPEALLVDELSLGLAPLVLAELMGIVQRLRDELGLGVLLVEQNAAAALAVADHGYVIEQGRIVYAGTAAELAASADVQEFYLGTGRQSAARSYREVKQYRRRRRWFG
jgi:branched-chain amino acid transport system ATP-binding protein